MLVFLCLIVVGRSLPAQQDTIPSKDRLLKYKPELWIQGNVKGGFLIAHRSVMAHLITQHSLASEVGVVFQTKNRKNWNHDYKNPRIALNAYFGNLGNDKVLGYSLGLYACVSMPLVKAKWYEFSAKAGVGVAYMNKRFHQEKNPLNVGVSTPINVLVLLGLESRFKINDRSAITFSLDATHFSNGATTVPNLGLNLPFLAIGYQHKIQDPAWIDPDNREVEGYTPSFSPKLKRWELGAMAIGSVKEVFPVNQKKFGVFGFNLIGRRYFNQKVAMEMSFDFMLKESIKVYNPEVEKTYGEIIQLGLYAGYILPFERFHAIVGMGVYVRDKYSPQDAMYHRLGMRYVFKNGININLTLKSHWARADYVEYGIGYTFTK